MMISSAFNTPADWLRAGGAFTTIDDFAAHHHGFAPVLVFVDPDRLVRQRHRVRQREPRQRRRSSDQRCHALHGLELRGERRPRQLGRRRMVDGRYLRRRPDRHASGDVQRIRRHRRRHPPQHRHQGPHHRPVVRRQCGRLGRVRPDHRHRLGTAATPGCRDGSTSPHRPGRTASRRQPIPPSISGPRPTRRARTPPPTRCAPSPAPTGSPARWSPSRASMTGRSPPRRSPRRCPGWPQRWEPPKSEPVQLPQRGSGEPH